MILSLCLFLCFYLKEVASDIYHQNIVSFAKKFGVQLGKALMKSEEFAVITSNSKKKLSYYQTDIEHLAATPGIEYLLAGDLQELHNDLRVHLQMIRLSTGHLTWSQMYERNFSTEKLFEVQDEIVNQAAMELSRLQPQ